MDLSIGDVGVISCLNLPIGIAHRLADMGFVRGTSVEACHHSMFGDPRVYRVKGALIAIRNTDAAGVNLIDGVDLNAMIGGN